jgi:hypothetical protein
MIPILIGGTGRSGTTILKRVLSCHSRIVSIPVELRVVVDPGGALDLVSALSDRWSPYHADTAIQRFRRLLIESAGTSFLQRVENKLLTMCKRYPHRYAQLRLGKHFGNKFYHERIAKLIDDITFHVSRSSWIGSYPYQRESRVRIYEAGPFAPEAIASIVAEFFHDLYRARAGNGGQTHWVEDTPTNLLHAHELLRLFPNMRLIHIYRDMRDVLASYMTKRWGGDSIEAAARRLSGIMQRWLEIRERLPQQSFMEIGLEMLADAPQVHLTRICEFVGLEYELSLAQIPLDRVNAGRWRRELAQNEVCLVQPWLAPCLKAYGYTDA